MADISLSTLIKRVDKLAGQLDRRQDAFRRLETYYEGESPMPAAITAARVTKAYRRMMPLADTPWGSLIVGSVLDRLEIGGITDKNETRNAGKVWDLWQANQMDSESKLAHDSALMSGRAFALVWPGDDDGDPEVEISLDNSEQMIIQYAEGSRRDRRAALRRWEDCDSGVKMATLYLPDGIYKFQEADAKTPGVQAGEWTQRIEPGEEWPVKNPWGVVPVVEIPINQRLKAGEWGHARGEYAHCLGLIDRINMLTFLGLVVAFWMGFPVRGVIGDRILRDDDGKVIPPFDVAADSIAQLENPQAKFAEFAAADRDNLLIYPEIAQLAAITKTPRHYFPLSQPNVNISADAIRADEGALNAKVTGHKGTAGGGWLETQRLLGLMSGNPLSPNARVEWVDHESRSLAERADAATKLKDILPWQALAMKILNATQDDVAMWEAMRTSDQLGQILAATSLPSSAGAVGANGNVTPPKDATPPTATAAPPAG